MKRLFYLQVKVLFMFLCKTDSFVLHYFILNTLQIFYCVLVNVWILQFINSYCTYLNIISKVLCVLLKLWMSWLTLYIIWLILDQHQKGNIFTLFLHSPLMAFCYISNIADIPVALWDKCQVNIDKFIAEASRLLTRSRTLGEKFLWVDCLVELILSD